MKKSEKWLAAAITILLLLSAESLLEHKAHAGYGFGFYAWFGGLACLLIIVVALLLGRLLKRKDNYYQRDKQR